MTPSSPCLLNSDCKSFTHNSRIQEEICLKAETRYLAGISLSVKKLITNTSMHPFGSASSLVSLVCRGCVRES